MAIGCSWHICYGLAKKERLDKRLRLECPCCLYRWLLLLPLSLISRIDQSHPLIRWMQWMIKANIRDICRGWKEAFWVILLDVEAKLGHALHALLLKCLETDSHNRMETVDHADLVAMAGTRGSWKSHHGALHWSIGIHPLFELTAFLTLLTMTKRSIMAQIHMHRRCVAVQCYTVLLFPLVSL